MWTKKELQDLQVNNGIRQRGVSMTRTETFCDGAFAFALTLLVVGGGSIPQDYDSLINAFKGIPAFAASFALLASFWWAHRQWSNSYGLDDRFTTVISLLFVFVMLIYVYPLRMVFSAFAAWLSNGFFITEFTLKKDSDMPGLFFIYGIGLAIQMGILATLYYRALSEHVLLQLNEVEILRTKQAFYSHLAVAMVGLISALWAALLPPKFGIYAGFIYFILALIMPMLSIRFERLCKNLN